MQEQTKEVTEYQNQVSFVKDKADSLEIVSEEGMTMASDLLNDLKKVEKAVVERKKEITGPLMEALSSARELFKPVEKSYASAKTTIKAKMLDFTVTEETRIEKEKAKVEARLEKGTMRTDTAVEKIENIGNTKKTFKGASSKTSLRTVTKIRITNEDLIPREFMVPNMKLITEAVLRQKRTVEGVETYEDKTIVSRSN